MKKKMPEVPSFYLGIYGIRCFVITNDKQSEAIEKKLLVQFPELDTPCRAIKLKTDEGIMCIVLDFRMDRIDNSIELIGCIAHEASHATMYVFNHIGENPDNISHEPYAYLVGYIAKNMYEILEKKIVNW